MTAEIIRDALAWSTAINYAGLDCFGVNDYFCAWLGISISQQVVFNPHRSFRYHSLCRYRMLQNSDIPI